jgi:hypothetical protein
LAGVFNPVDEARATEVGCDRVLIKPFDPQLVISSVGELLGGPKKVARAAPLDSTAEPVADLDTYFERLDQAFAHSVATSQPGYDSPPEAYSIDIEDALDPAAAAAESADRALSVASLSYASGPEAFGYPIGAVDHDSATSAIAEGGVAAAFLSTNRAPALSDAVIDEIATRVLARLMVRLSTGDVPEAVSEAAGRLVRAEIERLKSRL